MTQVFPSLHLALLGPTIWEGLLSDCFLEHIILIVGLVNTLLAHLGMVHKGIFGHSTLLLHQETESPPLFCECRLIAIRHIVLQLTLLVTDSFDKL